MGYANPATFDPGNKGTNVTLSGSNLVATVSTSNGEVRTTIKFTGPSYFEMAVGATMSGIARVGLITPSVTNFTQNLGDTTASADLGYLSGGTVRLNSAVVATLAAFVASDNIGVAYDPVNLKIWFRVNGGNWNNDILANQNPVGAIGGISVSAMPYSLGVFPAFSGTATSSATAKFATASWVYTAPTGFITIDTIACTGFINGGVASRAATFPTYGRAHGLGYGAAGTRVSVANASRAAGAADGAFYGNYKLFSPAGPQTAISGVVKENGTVVSGRKVYLYDRVTGLLLGSSTSGATGLFSIPALGRTGAFVVAVDAPYNALIYDNVTPV